MPRKKTSTKPSGDEIVRTRKSAAKALGVTERTLATWPRESWWPADAVEKDARGRRTNWNLTKIRAAIEGHGRKGSGKSKLATRIKLAQERQKLKRMRIATRREERQDLIDSGKLLPREEYTAFLSECVTVCRDQILALPKHLAKLVTGKKLRGKLQVEGDVLVRRALDALADAITKPPA
ncbi:MAG: hypothetical protein KY476_10860 [Planctomycetes bacterium]|nr:hypothetical protein [Planctomycetota bacterium]